MVDIILLQSISYVAVALGVVLAAINYVVTSGKKRSQQTLETRQAQLFMQIYNRWSEKDFVDAWNLVCNVDPPVYRGGVKPIPK